MNKDVPYWWPTPQSFIAILLSLAMVGLLFVLVLKPNPVESDMAKMVVGAFITTGFAAIIAFYFGSSKGSEKKDDALLSGTISPTPLGGTGSGTTATTTTGDIKVNT